MYIAIEGPIGVGKTTLARLLASRLNTELLLEVVEENPFLPLFYQDPQRYAFKVQAFFLLSRYKQLQSARTEALVADYLFDKDAIFAAMNLVGPEWDLYHDFYAHLSPRLTVPDLTIYLRAPLETLLERIRRRGRPFEQDMQAAYLQTLTDSYDRHFASYTQPLWILEADRVDYSQSGNDQDWIVGQVISRLANQYEQVH